MNWYRLLLLLLVSHYSMAQIDPVDSHGLAIGGYDVVAYQEAGKAIKGSNSFTAQYNEVIYFFSSRENQQLFEANPEKFIPQFDGYCALSVSYGKKISIDPETFKVIGDKVYLFYNGPTSRGKINSMDTWNKSEDRLLKKANALWPEVKKLKYKYGTTY
jgi:YHS domain-containing protein